VEIRVPENYADDVLPGTPGVISYDNHEYAGQVTSLSPEVNQNQVEGRVAFGDETPAGLKQNQRVSMRLILESHPAVLKVPRGPYLESGGGRSVYVLKDGLATLREISVGASSVSEVEILHGLEEGEQILLTEVTRFNGANTVLIRD
jgi:HlyD family secretion protein